MGGIANSIFAVLLSWVRSAASSLWQLIFEADQGVFFRWIGENWKQLAIVICIIGMVIDLMVHQLRWRTHWVWFSFLRRLFGYREQGDAAAAAEGRQGTRTFARQPAAAPVETRSFAPHTAAAPAETRTYAPHAAAAPAETRTYAPHAAAAPGETRTFAPRTAPDPGAAPGQPALTREIPMDGHAVPPDAFLLTAAHAPYGEERAKSFAAQPAAWDGSAVPFPAPQQAVPPSPSPYRRPEMSSGIAPPPMPSALPPSIRRSSRQRTGGEGEKPRGIRAEGRPHPKSLKIRERNSFMPHRSDEEPDYRYHPVPPLGDPETGFRPAAMPRTKRGES